MFAKYTERVHEFESTVCKFPTSSNNIISEEWAPFRRETLENMKGSYPLIHGGVLSMAHDFLAIKREYGTEIEKKLYHEMSMVEFFDRLATKRCVVFYQSYDVYLLRNGYNDSGKWESIGTEDENKVTKYDVAPEKKPKIAEYLSYDELVISAMGGVSSPTHFVNKGDRGNCGRPNADPFYPAKGVYLGLIGARFERPGVMEHALLAVTESQNTKQSGYGPLEHPVHGDGDGDGDEKEQKMEDHEEDENAKGLDLESELNGDEWRASVDASAKSGDRDVVRRVFERFYHRNHLPIYSEVRRKWTAEDTATLSRYTPKTEWADAPFLDTLMFRARIRVSLELFLFDADRRASQCDRTAFCYVVGLGTGVWSFKKRVQNRAIAEVTRDIVAESRLGHIAAVYFAWMTGAGVEDVFESDALGGFFVADASGHKIVVQRGKRAPADKLEEPFKDCLNVAMYAWDSNSFPGNEYYLGLLSASGDPAAASCSTIPFVQNPEINKEYICGANTGIYFYDRGSRQYEFVRLGDIDFENNKEKWLRKSLMSIPYKRDLFVDGKASDD